MTQQNRPERGDTNESLRVDREKTDDALAENQAEIEADADEVIRRARRKADTVLATERDEADARSVRPAQTGGRAALVEERANEDQALHEERADQDEAVRAQRDATTRALAMLLPLEREKTDRYLLTERARSDEALANRDGFLGMVSHDLRNLLGGIALSATLLTERGDAAVGERIQRYVARMNRLIGDLVDVSLMEAGKLSVGLAPDDASALVTEVVDTFGASAATKGVSLTAAFDDPPPLQGIFDRDRLMQVLANLVTNAIKFTPSGGRVRVAVERAGEELEISVADTGCGIPADQLEAVFERFWQVGKHDTRGVGLGLFISRCIVEAHGGRIWAESGPGGATLRFTLPAETTPSSA